MAPQAQRDEWARADAKTSNDLARIGAQSAILINGGAAVAVLAFVGSLAKDGNVLKPAISIPQLPLAMYAAGVFFGALSLLVMSKAIENYMGAWLEDASSSTARQRGARATKLWWTGLGIVALALACFIIASLLLAIKLDRVAV